MRAGKAKNKIRRSHAKLILEWMLKHGFDIIDCNDALYYNDDRWEVINQLRTAKVLEDYGDSFRLNRERATRYMEKWG
jgi:hypothetical protein